MPDIDHYRTVPFVFTTAAHLESIAFLRSNALLSLRGFEECKEMSVGTHRDADYAIFSKAVPMYAADPSLDGSFGLARDEEAQARVYAGVLRTNPHLCIILRGKQLSSGSHVFLCMGLTEPRAVPSC